MNIYLIERTDNILHFYDIFVAAVVVAESEFDAKCIHPAGITHDDTDNWMKESFEDTWTDIENIKVTLIGETYFSDEQIILAHFRAS